MAKLNSTSLVITVSQLLRDDQPSSELIDQTMLDQIEAVVQQLASESANAPVLIEVIKAE
jgi:anti-sigma factor ChrR (cupin superfamily)